MGRFNTIQEIKFPAVDMSARPSPIQQTPHQTDLAILFTKMDILQQHVGDVKETQTKMAEAINTLAVVEEKQSTTIAAVDRAFKIMEKYEGKQEKLEERVRVLENQNTSNRRTNKWVETAVLGIVMVAAMYVAKATGLG